MDNQLTIGQALDEGYKYCCNETGESGLLKLDGNIDFTWEDYFLCEKEPRPYLLSDTCIKDAVSDLLANQDEVNDEDGELCDIVESVDYTEITAKVNAALSVKKYYRVTDIQLIK